MSKTIYHHYVEISDSAGIMGANNKFTVSTFTVIGENDRFMVVDDTTFTTIDKSNAKYSIGTPMGKEQIHTYANDTVWGNRITYSLYSEKRNKAEAIRKAIEKEVGKRYGFFAKSIDLSVIADKV